MARPEPKRKESIFFGDWRIDVDEMNWILYRFGEVDEAKVEVFLKRMGRTAKDPVLHEGRRGHWTFIGYYPTLKAVLLSIFDSEAKDVQVSSISELIEALDFVVDRLTSEPS